MLLSSVDWDGDNKNQEPRNLGDGWEGVRKKNRSSSYNTCTNIWLYSPPPKKKEMLENFFSFHVVRTLFSKSLLTDCKLQCTNDSSVTGSDWSGSTLLIYTRRRSGSIRCSCGNSCSHVIFVQNSDTGFLMTSGSLQCSCNVIKCTNDSNKH